MSARLDGAIAVAAIAIVMCTAGAAAAGGSGIAGRITAGGDDQPLAGATVLVVGGGAYVANATTGDDGTYAVAVRPGTYERVVVFGEARLVSRVTVRAGKYTVADGELSDAPSEVIELEAPRPAAVEPKPRHPERHELLAYSDDAIDEDAWTRAWLLLEVSKQGKVTRVKMLHAPGHGLDDIAVRGAFDLAFEPGRDEHGRPMRVWMVWGFEWPAISWLASANRTRAGRPTLGTTERFIPCRGSGPWHFGTRTSKEAYTGYRDCTMPDVSKADQLPWIDKKP